MIRFKSILRGMLAIAFVGMLSSCALTEIKCKDITISLDQSYENRDYTFFGLQAHVAF